MGEPQSSHSCKVQLVLLAPGRTLLGNTAERLKNTNNWTCKVRERGERGEREREGEGEGKGEGERVFWNYFNANSRVPWQQKIYIITLKTQQRVPV